MREIEPRFELFDIAHVGAGNWVVGDGAGTEIPRLGEIRGTAREFKNTGNKARMLLKAKDITFLNVANQTPWRANRQKSGSEGSKGNLGKRGQALASHGEAEHGQIVGYTGTTLTWPCHSAQGLRFQAVGFWRECRFNPCGLSCRIGKALIPIPSPAGRERGVRQPTDGLRAVQPRARYLG